jgi:pyrroline-5-carboxylate reductase
MNLGFIGAGNMATALARGIGEPVLVSDVNAQAANTLASETGGDAFATNREVAERADVVVLCHKPPQLGQVAEEIAGRAKAIVSVLAGTPLAALELAYPDRPVYRFMPNIPAELKQGVFVYSGGTRAAEGPEQEILELFGRAGMVIPVAEPMIAPATALMGSGPGFFALFVEAFVDAGVRHGLTPDQAAKMTVGTMAGTAAVIAANDFDAVALRRRVTSPGGTTARGLEAFERTGLRASVAAAVGDVVEMTSR